MTASVPESFSMDELTAALESAPAEDELRSNVDKREYSQEYIEQVASDALDMASDLVKDPLVHKVMAMMIVNRMISWHTMVGESQLEDGNQETAICWFRDAGKFQAMMDSLIQITVGDSDFTCIHTEE
jgi:DNA-dependent RNA polymerase auxiliary subunit epsilon